MCDDHWNPCPKTVNKCLVETIDCEDLEEDEELGIRAVEEMLTDFMQMTHIMLGNVIPKPKAADDSTAVGGGGDEDDDFEG